MHEIQLRSDVHFQADKVYTTHYCRVIVAATVALKL